MEFTGERPTVDHEVTSSRMRYKSVVPLCINRVVLDYGCGIGVGSFFLAQYANQVYGYEPNVEALEEARRLFNHPDLQFIPSLFPHVLKEVDIVCMNEVMEHIERPELDRLLTEFSSNRFDLVCTTPNGDLFPYHPATVAERRGYHVWHYTEEELKALFGQFFKFVEVYGHVWDPAIKLYTSYMVYASNMDWSEDWIFKIRGPR